MIYEPTEFEIHVTVAYDEDSARALRRLKGVHSQIFGHDLDLKVKEINNFDFQRNHTTDIFVTQRVTGGTYQACMNHKDAITWFLEREGFTVIREKIEVPPFEDQNPKGYYGPPIYFELHYEVSFPDNRLSQHLIERIQSSGFLGVSQDIDKKPQTEISLFWVTYRNYDVRPRLIWNIQYGISDFIKTFPNITVVRSRAEIALYDSAPLHDSKWLPHLSMKGS